MFLLTYTPPDQRTPLGAFPHVVQPQDAESDEGYLYNSRGLLDCTVAELLLLVPCFTCGREDRLALRSFRQNFRIHCDCGSDGFSSSSLICAVNHWNHGPQINSRGQFVAPDGATPPSEELL